MTLKTENKSQTLLKTLRQACKKIAPVWPLESFVAVNPYLGLSEQKFDSVAQYLAKVGGIQMTLPASFYLSKIQKGEITHDDLAMALSKYSTQKSSITEFLIDVESSADKKQNQKSIASLTDVATEVLCKDWNRFFISRVSTWSASFFDKGQAAWKAAISKTGTFAAWKAEAEIDFTTEIMGLKGFRKQVKSLPADPIEAVKQALEKLDLPEEALPLYLHCLLLKVGGWSAYAARLDWDRELYGGKDGQLIEFLSVLICWEFCLYQCLKSPKLEVKWIGAKKQLVATKDITEQNEQLTHNLILQESFDYATQRKLIAKFQNSELIHHTKPTKIKTQAVFCIDVRSEVFRRNWELVDHEVETIGFAGFFAFPINYVPIAHNEGEAQCPVLIKTGPTILEEISEKGATHVVYQSRLQHYQLQQLWKSFKTGAITCFSFVSPMGLSYLPKLFTDSFGFTRPVPHPDKVGLSARDSKYKGISLDVSTHNNKAVGIPPAQRVQMAKNALSAMSLTDDFANFILIVGHGSTTVNNPHATGLDCGACGGHSGEANAKVAAAVLNDKIVRKELEGENIFIPESTIFLACLHDTTTDEVSIFNQYDVPPNRYEELRALEKSLKKAGHAARTERALKMSIDDNVDFAIKSRSKDWSQVRPEWGLAGCTAFVVAPRERSRNIDLGGQAFLHSYEWKKDKNFAILELIMTAPMVVTSWINLQYYASTVDNKNFGSGNKTLHNVTAGLGVLEGFSGDLRVGLPMQSVHDGEKYQHEPVKLNVIIEAPIDAMNIILKKHQIVKNLCDNGWIVLFQMDGKGKVSHRYKGQFNWETV